MKLIPLKILVALISVGLGFIVWMGLSYFMIEIIGKSTTQPIRNLVFYTFSFFGLGPFVFGLISIAIFYFITKVTISKK